MTTIEIGRLLRANTSECVIGCQINAAPQFAFGNMVKIPISTQELIFGLIYDIRIDDDGLVRQLSIANNIPEAVILDNRLNRNVPVEMSVVFIGFERDGKISHLLPAHPPLSLDKIYLCDESDLCRFTGTEKIGYLRHILGKNPILPVADLLAAHIKQVALAQTHNPEWVNLAIQEIITLLRDDFPTLTSVLSALADADIGIMPE
jgi:hypothetical protein